MASSFEDAAAEAAKKLYGLWKAGYAAGYRAGAEACAEKIEQTWGGRHMAKRAAEDCRYIARRGPEVKDG